VCSDGVAQANTPCTVSSSVRGNQLSGTFNISVVGPSDLVGSLPIVRANVTGIPFDATEAQLKSLIESQARAAVGNVSVSRQGPDPQRGYIWTVTFVTAMGDIPAITGTVNGMAVNPRITVVEERKGTLQEFQLLVLDGGIQNITGFFQLGFGGQWSLPISANVSTSGGCNHVMANVDEALERMGNIGTVSITGIRTAYGCAMNITFTSNSGNLALLNVSSTTDGVRTYTPFSVWYSASRGRLAVAQRHVRLVSHHACDADARRHVRLPRRRLHRRLPRAAHGLPGV
jgi:hypothetical protein